MHRHNDAVNSSDTHIVKYSLKTTQPTCYMTERTTSSVLFRLTHQITT
jgi:hypothetical protein